MKPIKCKCPSCGSMHTHDWTRKLKFGFSAVKEEFPDYDDKDYLLLANKCDECGEIFYTKQEVEIKYVSGTQPIVLSDDEAIGLGIR